MSETLQSASRPGWVWLALAVIACFLAAPPVLAQQDEGDQGPTNLQVLPKDISGEALETIMRSWSQALGVRCIYCHADPPEGNYDELDWASDVKMAKWTARDMLKLVRSSNEAITSLSTITHQPARVTCMTCHRGVARPIPLEELLHEVYTEQGTEAAVTRYEQLREDYRDGFAYDFREGTLTKLGERLTREGKPGDALVFLRLNAERFPASEWVQMALSDAHLANGDVPSAIAAMEKALELNPRIRGGREKLEALRSR